MKKSIIFLILALVISNSSLVIAKSDSWKALYDRTNAYMEKQDFQTALQWGEKALAQAEKEFGKLDTNYIKSLNLLYISYRYNYNFDKVIKHYNNNNNYFQFLKKENIGKFQELIYSVIDSYYWGETYSNKVLNLLDESLENYFFLSHGDSLTYVDILELKTKIYIMRGQFQVVDEALQEITNYKEKLYNKDTLIIIEHFLNKGWFYNFIGQYDKAELYFNKATSWFNKIQNIDTTFYSYSLSSTAWNYMCWKHFDKAEDYFIKALSIHQEKNKNDSLVYGMILKGLSHIYDVYGYYKKAEPLAREALNIRLKIWNKNECMIAGDIIDFALLLSRDEKQNEVLSLLEEGLKKLNKCFEENYVKNIFSAYFYLLIDIANYYAIINKLDESEKFFSLAFKKIKYVFDESFQSFTEHERKKIWDKTITYFEGFNTFVLDRKKENPKILQDLYDMQLYTKSLLFNATSKVKERILNSDDSTLIQKYNDWSDKKEFLVKLYSMTEDEVKKKGFDIDSIENLANELEKELTLKSEDFKQAYEKKKISWRSIQTILQPDEAAVEVIRFRKRGKVPNQFNPDVMIDGFTDTVCYAFLIVSEKTEDHPELVLLENGKELENEFYNDYRGMIKSKLEDMKSYSRYWEKLHEKLKGYKKIYFSADGIYNKLNPSTFLMPDGKYLLDVYDIQQLNSTKDILLGFYETKQESNIYNSAVLIGNPNFSLSEEEVRKASERIRSESQESEIWEPMASTRGIQLTKLPGTEKEIEDVAQFLKSRNWVVKNYVGDMALKTAVKAANSPRVLHIATHGMFLEDVKRESSQMFGFDEQRMVDNPLLRSGLFFTGADNYLKAEEEKPTGDENGVLTAYEAMNLNLDRTELVVLSACETGLGEVKNGEGVFGLRRAFQTAGAKTIVMSLWTVSDQATQELMSNFYSNWVTGMTKRDAFSKAQQTVKDKYKDPTIGVLL